MKKASKRKPARKKPAKKGSSMSAKARPPLKPGPDGVVRLSGGNPQIPKGDGDAPVQAFIAAMPGWQSAVGKQVDELIVRAVPDVQKAVRWNSPFYGIEGSGFFVSFHCFTRYVKVTFIRGRKLQPMPPVDSKDPDARYLHIHEGDKLDEAQFTGWLEQAAALPGWIP